jgi:hypothetical protein
VTPGTYLVRSTGEDHGCEPPAASPIMGEMTTKPCSPDELRTLFLFEKLTDAQFDWLCRRGRVEIPPAGPVYAEG